MLKHFFIILLLTSCIYASEHKLVINEVMANAIDEYKEEFIELYNYGDSDIDLAYFKFTDGTGLDQIILWDETLLGSLNVSNVIYSTTVIPANSYAVILDPQYIDGTMPYVFGDNALILTVLNTTLGSGGLKNSGEPLTLYDNLGNLIDTYGTPVISTTDTYTNADDDMLDGIPFDSGNGISIERIKYEDPDLESNWASCKDPLGATPGKINSVLNNDENENNNDSAINSKEYNLKITEIMPCSKTKDFIELVVLEDAVSVGGYKLFEGNTLVKTFPDIVLNKEDYIVLHFNSNNNDEFNVGDNPYWDFYTKDSGLTGTDNTITLKDNFDRIIDFVFYSNKDNTLSTININLIEIARLESVWICDNIDETGGIFWNEDRVKSIQRLKDTTFNPKDTNGINDWTIESTTIGYGYFDKFNNSFTGLEIENSPFSPYGNTKHMQTKIKYFTRDTNNISVKMFNIQGRMVRSLINNGNNGYGVVYWDGKDDFGQILPVGVYIVYFEGFDNITSKRIKDQKLVVLTKKL